MNERKEHEKSTYKKIKMGKKETEIYSPLSIEKQK
jgi:hypothetical protein